MPDITLEKRLIDNLGLNAKAPLDRYLLLFKDINLVLALLQGMGPDGAQLLNVDANGNLLVSVPAGGIDTDANIDEWGGVAVAVAANGADALANFVGPKIYAEGLLLNNVTYDRARSASAANLIAALGLGATLVASPGQWSVSSAPANGAQASASRAAGGAGVRHICTGFEIIISGQAAAVGGQLLVNLRDGATGAGGILKQWAIEIPTATVPPIVIPRSGCSYVGTAATAMTLESSAAYAAVGVSVSLDGYDAS